MDWSAIAQSVAGQVVVSTCLEILSFLGHQVWLIPLLIALLVLMRITMKGQERLREKICIDGKPYHDIMLDILYFSRIPLQMIVK